MGRSWTDFRINFETCISQFLFGHSFTSTDEWNTCSVTLPRPPTDFWSRLWHILLLFVSSFAFAVRGLGYNDAHVSSLQSFPVFSLVLFAVMSENRPCGPRCVAFGSGTLNTSCPLLLQLIRFRTSISISDIVWRRSRCFGCVLCDGIDLRKWSPKSSVT